MGGIGISRFTALASMKAAELEETRHRIVDPPTVNDVEEGPAYYYPSVVVRLTIRFDEALQVEQDVPDPVDAATGLVNPFELAPTSAQARPLIISRSGDDGFSYVHDIVPRSCEVDLPSFRTAGTFRMTIAFADLPIDPLLFRTIAVQVHAGCVSPSEFGEGMAGAGMDEARRARLTELNDDTLLILGTVDEITVDHENVSTIELTGRDLRGVLIDADAPANAASRIDATRPIDEVVAQIISMDPHGDLLGPVVVQPQEWPNEKVPSPGDGSVVTRVNKGADGSKPGNAPPGESSKTSYWDLITHYCNLVGAVPFFQGAQLRIRPGRALYDRRKQGRFDPILDLPFRDAQGRPAKRVGRDGVAYAVRRFVYGNNLSKIKFTRKLGAMVVPTVRCTSVDESGSKRGVDKFLSAEWPPSGSKKYDKARTSRVSTEGTGATDIVVVPQPGISSRARLLEIAKDLYEQIGRQEIGGSCETKDLASLGGSGVDPDLLRMRPGDAVEFLADTHGLGSRSPIIAAITNAGTSFNQAVQLVTQAMERSGWRVDENLARAVVATARSSVVGSLRFFHVNNVRVQWSGAGTPSVGVSFSFDNFVTARADVTESTGEVSKKPEARAAKRRARTNTSLPVGVTSGGSKAAALRQQLQTIAETLTPSALKKLMSGGHL